MPKQPYAGSVTWYRLESAKIILSTLTQTNNQYITCCKFAREEKGNHTIGLLNTNVAAEQVARGYSKNAPKKTYELTDYNFKGATTDAFKIDIREIDDAGHLVTSRQSPFISGGISGTDGDNLFKSNRYFHGNTPFNKITNGDASLPLSPPIFLRLRIPVDRLVKLSGGDTIVSNMGDVPTLGDENKPGFIPLSWVDRISWIADTTGYTKDALDELTLSSGFNDVRQYPGVAKLGAGTLFGTSPDIFLEAFNKLKTVDWIKKIDTATNNGAGFCSITQITKPPK